MVTFDGVNKLIICDQGTVELNVKDLYSLWKQWVIQDNNAGYLKAFYIVGGDPILENTFITAYYFLTNGWKVRPQEANHRLNVIGTLLTDDQSEVFVNTIGVFRVNINSVLPIKSETTVVNSGSSSNTGLTLSESTKLMSIPTVSEIAKELCEDKVILGSEDFMFFTSDYIEEDYIESFPASVAYVASGYVIPGYAEDQLGSTHYVATGYVLSGYVENKVVPLEIIDSCMTTLVKTIWNYPNRSLTVSAGLTQIERDHLVSLYNGLKPDERDKLMNMSSNGSGLTPLDFKPLFDYENVVIVEPEVI